MMMYLIHNWSSWNVNNKKASVFDYYRFERLSYQETKKNKTKKNEEYFLLSKNVKGQRLLDARNFIGHSYYIDV